MKTKFLFLAAIPLVLFLAGCSSSEDWTGVYYPNKDNIGDSSTWVIQPRLKTLEDCRDWVDGMAKNNKNFDYECARGCRNDSSGLTVCKETVK